ncbi:MAG: hypothetical protein HDR71_02375 [Lachnospiraceae bacterium]|nr:hypothetical protein [Lachnospiraceae bacterium]
MIYIVTAMYAEAHGFIDRFQLKKDISQTRFQVFRSKEGDMCLIISGTGTVPATVAVSSICMEYGAGQGDFLLNVGVCAGIGIGNVYGTKDTCQATEVYLCSKIREQSTGKTFYPDILYRHGFAEAQIVTGARPYAKAAQDETEKEDFYLYDMEAAAVYQAGSYFLGPHQMSFLKVISDDGNTKEVTSEKIESLMGRSMDSIVDHIMRLQEIAREEKQEDKFQEEALQKEISRLCIDMHCSKVMSESLRQYIRYCTLADVDHVSVIEEMYREGKLPCKDKREGKRCFEELKKKLL